MALNWNLSKIANNDAVCFSYTDGDNGPRRLRQITENLIWATIAVDLGEITAKNVDEWRFRLNCIALVYADASWAEITREDIAKHIGLSTNVSSRTRKQFVAKMAKALEREAADKVRYETQESAAA
jgi:hypothetical protein